MHSGKLHIFKSLALFMVGPTTEPCGTHSPGPLRRTWVMRASTVLESLFDTLDRTLEVTHSVVPAP
jgi:hypothetical protein